MERRSSPALLSVLFFGIALLYLPILVLIGYSFNASPLVNVWGGFSTTWYGQLLHNRQLLEAALLSLQVAVASSTGAVVLGTLAAIALVLFGGRGKVSDLMGDFGKGINSFKKGLSEKDDPKVINAEDTNKDKTTV